MVEEELDLENRVLCPDGACTGVIGEEGRCKECGRTAADRPTAASPAESPPQAEWKGESTEEDFDNRQLCPDGSCTGLLGPDGRCKVCGKSS